jgi:hypothetical protein
VILRAVSIWIAQLAAVVGLGILRQAVLEPWAGELRAHQSGTVLACIVVFTVICVSLPWIAPRSPQGALAIGVFWLLLAVAFEFGFFHLIRGVPWSRLLADYNLAEGRLLMLLWVTVLTGPVLAFHLTKHRAVHG